MRPAPNTHPPGEGDAADRLAGADFVYQRLCREVERLHRKNDPGLLPFIERTAQFAWSSHSGRFADGAIENVLLEIGRELAGPSLPDVQQVAASGRTLHVASEIYMTGGHSRVLAKWVQRDRSSQHSIVLTRQRKKLPPFLVSVAAERDAPITTLDANEEILERARQLRALSQGYDRVILHHHPDDPVPTIAYAPPGGRPVAMFNHAHFSFSLGSGVADVIINTLPYFQDLTQRRRFPRATDALIGPFGLDFLRWTDINKRAAKERLNLSPDQPVALTIGIESYFTPSRDVDFFRTLARLLSLRANLQVLMVGIPEQSALVPSYIHETKRVTFVGPVADPRPYYEAADLCLESFPMPSLGALVEAVAYGQAFPVPAFGAQSPLRVDQPQIASVAIRQRTEETFLDFICQLLDAPETTNERARELRQTLVEYDERFGDQFPSLYARIASFEHAPHELPRTACSATPEDLVLASRTQLARLGNAISMLPIRDAISAHMSAVAAGYESPRTAAIAFIRRLAPTGVRRLASSFRRSRK